MLSAAAKPNIILAGRFPESAPFCTVPNRSARFFFFSSSSAAETELVGAVPAHEFRSNRHKPSRCGFGRTRGLVLLWGRVNCWVHRTPRLTIPRVEQHCVACLGSCSDSCGKGREHRAPPLQTQQGSRGCTRAATDQRLDQLSELEWLHWNGGDWLSAGSDRLRTGGCSPNIGWGTAKPTRRSIFWPQSGVLFGRGCLGRRAQHCALCAPYRYAQAENYLGQPTMVPFSKRDQAPFVMPKKKPFSSPNQSLTAHTRCRVSRPVRARARQPVNLAIASLNNLARAPVVPNTPPSVPQTLGGRCKRLGQLGCGTDGGRSPPICTQAVLHLLSVVVCRTV